MNSLFVFGSAVHQIPSLGIVYLTSDWFISQSCLSGCKCALLFCGLDHRSIAALNIQHQQVASILATT